MRRPLPSSDSLLKANFKRNNMLAFESPLIICRYSSAKPHGIASELTRFCKLFKELNQIEERWLKDFFSQILLAENAKKD